MNSINKMHIANERQIICLNNNKIFKSIKEISDLYNIDSSSITKCCKDYRKSAGKDSVTGEKLKWTYYDGYIESINKEDLNV
jgi:hypothetical protein